MTDQYPSPVKAISPGFSEPDILSPCPAHVHLQRSDIAYSLLPQNFYEKLKYPTKTDAQKMFDEMLNSNCLKVFTMVLDAPIEIFDDDVIGPDVSKVQLFYGHPEVDISERYVLPTSLDCDSDIQELGFELLEDMYLAEIFVEPESIEDLSG